MNQDLKYGTECHYLGNYHTIYEVKENDIVTLNPISNMYGKLITGVKVSDLVLCKKQMRIDALRFVNKLTKFIVERISEGDHCQIEVNEWHLQVRYKFGEYKCGYEDDVRMEKSIHKCTRYFVDNFILECKEVIKKNNTRAKRLKIEAEKAAKIKYEKYLKLKEEFESK